MFVPEKWQMQDHQQQLSFIRRYSFATIVSPCLQASHIPLVFDREGKCLLGHLARNNPHWRELEQQVALAIFHGPHAYISPSWYQSKPAVPTWNYATVHVKGQVSLLSEQATMASLAELISKYEPELADGDIVTPAYQAKLAKGIVGFSLNVEQIDAKQKLGQHRSTADQQGVVQGLARQQNSDSQQLLAYMRELGIGLGE